MESIDKDTGTLIDLIKPSLKNKNCITFNVSPCSKEADVRQIELKTTVP